MIKVTVKSDNGFLSDKNHPSATRFKTTDSGLCIFQGAEEIAHYAPGFWVAVEIEVNDDDQ